MEPHYSTTQVLFFEYLGADGCSSIVWEQLMTQLPLVAASPYNMFWTVDGTALDIFVLRMKVKCSHMYAHTHACFSMRMHHMTMPRVGRDRLTYSNLTSVH